MVVATAEEVAASVVPFVDLAAQYRAIASELSAAVERVLSRCDFILGADVVQFESSFAAFVGVTHAIGVGSGLDALRLTLAALDIGAGDEVIVPANSFIATALAVTAVGARPVLVDCDASNYNIAVEGIETAVTPRTRAIIPVHLTGQSADMDPILEIGRRRGVFVIEDAAQAHGTLYNGRACGAMGVAGCFSFYPAKNLGASGDGGMITTNDAALADRLRRLRNYGQCAKYVHLEQGLNTRLDTLQAAILQVKLPYLPEWNATRARHAEHYRELLGDLEMLSFQGRVAQSTHIYHLFMVESDRRDDLRQHLLAAGVQTGIHYPQPIHLQPACADLGYRQADFPAAERLAGRTLSLPMFPELTPAQIERTAAAVRSFFT